MIKEALQLVIDNALAAQRVEQLTINDRTYTAGPALKEIVPKLADPLHLSTLNSLVEWAKTEGEENAEAGRLLIHVVDETTVRVVSMLDYPHRRREQLVTVDACGLPHLAIDQWSDQESFVIAVQTHFVRDETVAQLLRIAGTLRKSQAQTFDDDGVTQSVMASQGMKVGEVALPNPVQLRPFCTFAEIEQPLRPFVFRARGGSESSPPSLALLSVGDAAWKLEAMRSAAAYIAARVNSELFTVLV